MSTINALYGKETDMLHIYGPIYFHGYGNDLGSVTHYIKKKHAQKCNCSVGATYEKIDGLSYSEVKDRDEKFSEQLAVDPVKVMIETVASLSAIYHAARDGKRDVAGQRSRVEWDAYGNIIE